jgi:beta-glucanase (GH16 family)
MLQTPSSQLFLAIWTFALGSSLGCGSAPITTVSPPANTPAAVTTWVLAWSDEFDGPAGSSIDAAKWNFDLGDGCQKGNCGWGNNEKEYYSNAAENISLNGEGQLAIVARVAPLGLTCYYGPCRYTSAKITTRGKMTAEPGRVEARIKLAAGQGLWPAFWMLGHDFPNTPWPACGELDIMENKGSEPIVSSSAIHGPGYSGNTPFAHRQTVPTGALTDFHVFAVEWDSESVRFFVDNVPHYVVVRSELEHYGKSILDQSFFVILNLAVGGHFDGDPQSDAIFPATMLVDYVRVYKAERR